MTEQLCDRLQSALVIVGTLCVAWYLGVRAEMWIHQSRQEARLEQALATTRLAPVEGSPVRTTESPNAALVGRIEIGRLGLSTIVEDGSDPATLRVAAGHIRGTPLPWQRGNSAVAGHRDTFFRKLASVAIDDEIRFVTRQGTFRYVVRQILIVQPDQAWVLAPTRRSRLTLVTCYPFDAIGPAPLRYIVAADLVN